MKAGETAQKIAMQLGSYLERGNNWFETERWESESQATIELEDDDDTTTIQITVNVIRSPDE
jgi:hypothetical protein